MSAFSPWVCPSKAAKKIANLKHTYSAEAVFCLSSTLWSNLISECPSHSTLGAPPSALSRGHFCPVFSFLMWRNHRSVGLPLPPKSQRLFNVEEPQISRAAPSLRPGCFFSSSSFSPQSPRCTSSILGVLLSVSVRFGPADRFGFGRSADRYEINPFYTSFLYIGKNWI